MSRHDCFKKNSVQTFSLTILLGLFLNVHLGVCADRIRFAYPAKSLNYLPLRLRGRIADGFKNRPGEA